MAHQEKRNRVHVGIGEVHAKRNSLAPLASSINENDECGPSLILSPRRHSFPTKLGGASSRKNSLTEQRKLSTASEPMRKIPESVMERKNMIGLKNCTDARICDLTTISLCAAASDEFQTTVSNMYRPSIFCVGLHA